MTELVRQCCEKWDEDRCRLSSQVEGWGCRLMVCLPDTMPHTKRAKGQLFHKVYTYAEKCGVLECPHYRESIIDEVIDDPDRLAELVSMGRRTRTDLLSEDFCKSCK